MNFTGITESDALAIAMLATLLLSFGVVAMLLICMVRNSSRRDAQVDRLLEELSEDEKNPKKAKVSQKKREDWEKDGDWWKE